MTPARNMLARAVTLGAMALAVILLIQLFAHEDVAPASPLHDSTIAEVPVAEALQETAPITINYAPAYAALNPYADLAASSAASTFDPNDDYWGLPRSTGVDSVAAYCSACHSLQIVMQQRQTRDGWDYLLHWMVEKQGMAELPAETRADILDYLSREFSE